VNKSNNDTKIGDLLEEVQKSFPRLENWPDIYPTPTMRSLVVTAYKQVIEFSRSAAKYFAHFFGEYHPFVLSGKAEYSIIVRLALGIIAPSSLGINKVAALIHKTMAEINSEAMYGLHGRSQNIETKVVNSEQMIERLEAEVASSNEKLSALQLHAKRMEANNDLLRQYLDKQKTEFDEYQKEVEREILLGPSLLETATDF
jgi:hypothetical protein